MNAGDYLWVNKSYIHPDLHIDSNTHAQTDRLIREKTEFQQKTVKLTKTAAAHQGIFTTLLNIKNSSY